MIIRQPIKALFFWVVGSILGGGTAAVLTIFITAALFYLNIHPDYWKPLVNPLSMFTNLFYVLAGLLHGGYIGSIQGLLLLNKIPRNKQALYVSYKGSLLGLGFYGILSNCILIILTILTALDVNVTYFPRILWCLFFLSAITSSFTQGLIQHRIARRRHSEIFRWCLFSIIGGNLGLVLIFVTWFFVILNRPIKFW